MSALPSLSSSFYLSGVSQVDASLPTQEAHASSTPLFMQPLGQTRFVDRENFLQDSQVFFIFSMLNQRWNSPIDKGLLVELVKSGVWDPRYVHHLPKGCEAFEYYILSELDRVDQIDLEYSYGLSRYVKEIADGKANSKQILKNIRFPKCWEDLFFIVLSQYDLTTGNRFLNALESYFKNEVPLADNLNLPANLTSLLAFKTDRSMLWSKEAGQEFAEILKTSIEKIKQKTNKEPYIVEIAAGLGDLSLTLKAAMEGLVEPDRFLLTDYRGEQKTKSPFFEYAKDKSQISSLDIFDIKKANWKESLGLPNDAPVILIGSHLPQRVISSSLFATAGESILYSLWHEQLTVDEMIFVHTFSSRGWSDTVSMKRTSGGLDTESANRKFWTIESHSLDPKIWVNGVGEAIDKTYPCKTLKRQALLLQKYSRKAFHDVNADTKAKINGAAGISYSFWKWENVQTAEDLLAYIDYEILSCQPQPHHPQRDWFPYSRLEYLYKQVLQSFGFTKEEIGELTHLLNFAIENEVWFVVAEKEKFIHFVESLKTVSK